MRRTAAGSRISVGMAKELGSSRASCSNLPAERAASATLAPCLAKSRAVARPIVESPNALYVRTDYYKEAGVEPPKTWDDLLAAGKKLKAAGHPVGITLGHAAFDSQVSWYPVMWAFGGKEIDNDGKTVALESDEVVKAVEYGANLYQDAMDSSVFSYDDAGNNRAYIAGTISTTIDTASIYLAAIPDNKQLADNTALYLYPSGPAGQYGFHGGVGGFSIIKQSKNIDAAKRFLSDMMEEDFYRQFIKISEGYITPCLGGYVNKDIWPKDPKLAIYKDIGKIGRLPGWPGPLTRAASEAMSRFIIADMFAATANGMDPKKAAANAAAEYSQLLKS